MFVKQRVLIFSTAYLPLIGGAEIAVKEITQRLPDWHFDLVTAKIKPGLAKLEKIGNINVRRVGFGFGFDKFILPFWVFLKARKLQKKGAYDFIWAIMASFGGLAALFFKMKNPKIPYLLTLQEGDSPEHIKKRARWLGPFFKKIFVKADYIQTISAYLQRWAVKMGATCPIEVVPNGVDVTKFFHLRLIYHRQTTKNLKQKFGIELDEKVILTVSRLVPKNAVGDLIEAVKILVGEKLPVRLLIIGSGPLGKKLKLQVTRYKLQDKVLFLGTMPYDKLPKYYALADVFVRPSLSEGLGTAFLEAMAAGVPIIGTPVGGIPDFLEHKKTGLFWLTETPRSIAEEIKILLTKEALRDRLIAEGRRLIEKKYDWEIIAEKMGYIFEKLSFRRRIF